MIIPIFMLLLTIFPYALFAPCTPPNCCPTPGTFEIFPITLPKPITITVTNTLEFYNEPCKTIKATAAPVPPGTTITLSGSGSFVTEGQCLPFSKGESSIWLFTTLGYLFTGDTNIFDLNLTPVTKIQAKCYCHVSCQP
ncbi:hypothetical protein RclHR1_03520023 [Rhizophagus clarus]|uniref:IPT/TIG domain-containing protein n=1 Tax=Rhizophagus clarus TaxID=94130 RepID=A0A2Z6RBD3_9GLOM|nr:hypothetical protein RclHR1_03520023 [Rhizophagus clarus]GET03326.1 hypothetical protein RCL_jg8502.t1 [Rhizophagus clarus]